jgi:hypothetical protein
MVMSILKEVSIEVFIIVIVIICAILFLFLVFKEKKLKKTLSTKLDERDILFAEIDKIGISEEPPEQLVDKIDEIAKNFFEQEMKIPRNTDYSELITIFKDKNKPNLVKFAEIMTRLLYAGEEPTKETIHNLVYDLEHAVNQERDAIRIELQKKNQQRPEGQETQESTETQESSETKKTQEAPVSPGTQKL